MQPAGDPFCRRWLYVTEALCLRHVVKAPSFFWVFCFFKFHFQLTCIHHHMWIFIEWKKNTTTKMNVATRRNRWQEKKQPVFVFLICSFHSTSGLHVHRVTVSLSLPLCELEILGGIKSGHKKENTLVVLALTSAAVNDSIERDVWRPLQDYMSSSDCV